MSGIGSGWRPDGEVRYRLDNIRRLVGIMPAHCKKGLHLLYKTGYTAREVAHYPQLHAVPGDHLP